MGNWNITIIGLGAHHNDSEWDADELARELVEKLKEGGHTVSSATFTHGGTDDLSED